MSASQTDMTVAPALPPARKPEVTDIPSAVAKRNIEITRSTCSSLYQINTRVWLQELSRGLNRQATLDDISDGDLDRWSRSGFSWIWFLGVWQTGAAGRKVSRECPEWRTEFRRSLPDYTQDDVFGSCFAITQYVAHSDFGGNRALERLRRRIHEHGMRLLLDFVPNHTALDHPWVQQHPEFYVRGTEQDALREPRNYVRTGKSANQLVLAYGRDPYFEGWPDTLQLNYSEPSLQEAMRQELLKVAELCDGVRCDMAMLVLPEVFERTWGLRAPSFWPDAIRRIRSYNPAFLFLAEVACHRCSRSLAAAAPVQGPNTVLRRERCSCPRHNSPGEGR